MTIQLLLQIFYIFPWAKKARKFDPQYFHLSLRLTYQDGHR